jgi:hypothetical protein
MNAEIQNQRIKDVQIKINGLKSALGYARYYQNIGYVKNNEQVLWLEGELLKAEQKLANLNNERND